MNPSKNTPARVAMMAQASGGPANDVDAPAVAPVAPGLVVTVGDTGPVEKSLPRALGALKLIRPDVVMPHMYPDARTPEIAETVRREVPGARLWLQSPANILAGGSPAACEAKVRSWVRHAVEVGAEVLVFNGEGSSGDKRPGWKRNQPLTDGALMHRAELVVRVAADEADGRIVLAWSSHDRLASHGRDGLPVRSWFGPGSPIQLNLSQEYGAAKGYTVSRSMAVARHVGTQRDTLSLVGPRTLRPELASGGVGYVVVAQAWGHTVDAACYLHDQAAVSGAWTIPESSDATGILALRAVAELRRRAGHAPGRIARFQRDAGLKPDGVVGPKTLAALGIAR